MSAYRNGNDKVILIASLIYRRLTMDFVTTTERFGQLWKNDRQALMRASFALEFSITVAEDKKDCMARTMKFSSCCQPH